MFVSIPPTVDGDDSRLPPYLQGLDVAVHATPFQGDRVPYDFRCPTKLRYRFLEFLLEAGRLPPVPALKQYPAIDHSQSQLLKSNKKNPLSR